MFKIKDHGGEKEVNNFVSVAYNRHDDTYHIIWNSRFRTPLNKTYKVDEDYDFGSINVIDLLIDKYQNNSLLVTGITEYE